MAWKKGKQTMNNPIKSNDQTWGRRALTPLALAGAIGLLTMASSLFAGGGNQGNPGIAPPNSNPQGHSYGEWTALWWQWALSIPEAINPLEDTTGQFADVGQ